MTKSLIEEVKALQKGPSGAKTKVGPEKAMVAFGDAATDVCVLWCTKGVAEDMAEGLYNGCDVFEHGMGDNPDHGIWVWEGWIQINRFDTDYGADFDVEYNGEWREPTDREWAAARRRQNPFKPQEQRRCAMNGCNRMIRYDNKSGYCIVHSKRKCKRCGAVHRTAKTLCMDCRRSGK
jgi:hypothetical protein